MTTRNDLDEGKYVIDIADEQINIQMHEKTRRSVEKLRSADKDILFPALYMSALTHAIQNMEENKDRKWAEALAKALKPHKPDKDDLKEKPYKYAQLVLNNPLSCILKQEEQND